MSEPYNRPREQQESVNDVIYLKSQLTLATQRQNETERRNAFLKSQLEHAAKMQKESDQEIVTLVSELQDAKERQKQQYNEQKIIPPSQPGTAAGDWQQRNSYGVYNVTENKFWVSLVTTLCILKTTKPLNHFFFFFISFTR